jgi:serine/threonine protein kinase
MLETSIMYALQGNPNVIRLIACQRTPQVALVTKLYDCNLFELLHEKPIVPDYNLRYAALFAYDMLNGMCAMHALGLAHLDIKPQNFLVEKMDPSRNATGLMFRVVVTDFGLTKQLENADQIKGRKKSLAAGLSYRYAPLEAFSIFENQEYADLVLKDVYKAIDVYGVAVCINELMTRDIPWGMTPYHEVMAKVRTGLRPRTLNKCPRGQDQTVFAAMTEMTVRGWAQDWRQRPEMPQLLATMKSLLILP